MSFILDALRKSELERQRQNGPSIAELPVPRDDRRLPWALLGIGALLAFNAGGLLYILLRDGSPAPAAADAMEPPAASSLEPAAAAPLPAPRELPPTLDFPADTQRPVRESAMADAAAPPPAPDPTLLPDPRVSYAAGPIETMPPPIADLPAHATAGLPQLSVDLHIYSDDPAKRAVFINGRRYQRGGVLAEGPKIEEINREGAVLSYRGQHFLLPRQ
jgi:general secretion pathway protein B